MARLRWKSPATDWLAWLLLPGAQQFSPRRMLFTIFPGIFKDSL